MNKAKLLFKGSSLRVFSLFTNILISLFLFPFLVGTLGERVYGLWIIVITIVGYFSMLDVGLSQATQRFVTRTIALGNNDDTNTAVSTSLFLFIGIGIISFVITLCVVAFGPYFIENTDEVNTFRKVVISLGASSSISFVFFAFKGILIAKMRYDIMSYTEIFALLLRTLLIVAFVNAGYSIFSLAVITALVELLTNVIIYYYAKAILPNLNISTSFCRLEELKSYFHYGKYIFLTTIADKIRFSVDSFVIASFIGLEMVTHYAVATRLIEYFSLLMQRIFSVVMPALTEDHARENWHALRNKFITISEISAFVSIAIGGVLLINGKVFISWWMGIDYLDALPVLIILCTSITVAVSQSPSVATLNAIAKHRFYSVITSFEAIINLTLSLLLVNSYGIKGVALGTAIPLFINKLIIQPVYTCKQIDFDLIKYYLVYGKHLLFGIFMHTFFFVLTKYISIDNNIAYMTISTALYSLIYLIIGLNYILSKSVLNHISNALPSALCKLIIFKRYAENNI